MGIDQLIFGGFLAINLIAGFFYGGKRTTLREYALGSKTFSTLALTASVVALAISATIYDPTAKVAKHGVSLLLSRIIGIPIQVWLTGLLISRMGEFMHCLSVAEAMGNLYGPVVRIITALGGILRSLGFIIGQLLAASKILSYLLDMEETWITILLAIVVTSYASINGIVGVTITDMIQVLTFSILIPILIGFIWKHSNLSIKELGTKVSIHPAFSLRSAFGTSEKMISWLTSFFFFVLPGLSPAYFQRILIARNIKQAKKGFANAALVILIVRVVFFCLSVLLITGWPKIEAESVMKHVLKTYGSNFIGLRGLAAAGVTAMAMSTADTHIHTSAVLFTHDVLPFFLSISNRVKLLVTRVFASCMGMGALAIALQIQDTDKLFAVVANFYMPIATIPLLMAILGFRTSRRAIFAGMGAAVMTSTLWHLCPSLASIAHSGMIPAQIANVIIVLFTHYFFRHPGGLVGIKVKAPRIAEKQARARRWRNFKARLAKFSLFNYLSRQLPKHEATYSLLGMYVMGPVFLGFWSLEGIFSLNHNLCYWTAYPMLILNALLATYPIWVASWKNKRFMTYFYPLTVGFNLFAVPSVLWIVSGYHKLYLLLLTVNFLLMLLQNALPFTGCMALFGLLGAHTLLGLGNLSVLHLAVQASSSTMIAYAGLLFGCYLMAFLRYRKDKDRIGSYYYQLVRENAVNTKALRKLRTTPERFVQQLRDKVTGLEAAFSTSKALQEALRKPKEKLDTKALTMVSSQLTDHIQDSSRYLTNLFALVEQGGLLRNKNIKLDTFTRKLLNAIARNPELHTALITANQSQAKTVNWDTEKIQNILLNGHKRLQKAHPDQDYFFLHIQDTHLAYPNYPEGLPAVALTLTIEEAAPPVEPTYLPPDKVLTIASTPYQRHAQQCVSIHYGFFGGGQAPNSYLFVLPQRLKAIRPGSISDTPAQSFSPAMLRKAKVIEGQFWTTIGKKPYDMPVIEKAVAFMKDAHGHQQRKSGEPYYTHPLTVAQYVSQYNNKQDILIAALLHDTIEDTDVTPEALKMHFSPRVSELVQHLSHIENSPKKHKLSDDQTHNKLANASHDKEAVLIKLCDRLHNLYTLGAMPKHKQIAKAKETLKVYIPLGKQVGYTQLAQELTRLCQAVLK